jgi:hypothetical protein
VVEVPVIPQFDLDLTPCPKIGGGALDTDLDLAVKGKRAQVRADCNANKLSAAQAALDKAIEGHRGEEP